MVAPFDGYVLVGTKNKDEVIVRPTDDAMEDYDIIITHVTPSDFLMNADEDEHIHGIQVGSGTVIGIVHTFQ